MAKTYIASDNIITSLGFTTSENFKNLEAGNTGVKHIDDPLFYTESFTASIVDRNRLSFLASRLGLENKFTPYEQLIILSIKEALEKTNINPAEEDTCIVLSTTKGNIDLLKNNKNGFKNNRVHLWKSAELIGNYFKTKSTPLVVSNACISGVMALMVADRLIKQGLYKNIIVSGCDVLSEFIVSGFQSFYSLSKDVCKPFDKDRTGLTLGEGAGTIILTSDVKLCPDPIIEVVNGAGSNDANHISGPSRTGEGLYIAINEVMKGSTDIDYISAHGTATPYNDDMESIALARNNLSKIPVNSFKGFIGHTLGAAGIIESIFCFESMRKNKLIKTYGLDNTGTAEKINVITENKQQPVNKALKTASGFGGSN
ncbi:MAG: hypothetical protein K8R86_04710, partial [Bacteroidales bacterium]|nr:hypothetical protein [Bacteroidales bacterium]